MGMRRILATAAVAASLVIGGGLAATSASAAPPHAEQMDGSDHGNSSKPARQDPRPTRGKDCQPHGLWGGMNEDHCADGTPG